MPQTAVDKMIETLDLEELEVNLFRGRSPQVGWQRVFGGQVIGQALVAAIRTVEEDRPVHSLHGYFMRPGDPSVPIIYEAERDRDGKSFTTRRVIAIQHGKPIFTLSTSFHRREEGGLDHQFDMPDVPLPEDLPSEKELLTQFEHLMPDNMKRYFSQDRAIEIRRASHRDFLNPKISAPEQHVWIRPTGKIPSEPAVHQAVLAYASDMTLLDTALVPHATHMFDETLQMASLDHAMWFHRDIKADDWLLYSQDAPTSGGSRGFARGSIYNREGVLIASAVQEGLMRKRTK